MGSQRVGHDWVGSLRGRDTQVIEDKAQVIRSREAAVQLPWVPVIEQVKHSSALCLKIYHCPSPRNFHSLSHLLHDPPITPSGHCKTFCLSPRVILIFTSVQLLSHVRFFETPWTAAHQASLYIANSRSLLKLMSIELVMPSSHPTPLSSPSPPAFNLSQHQGLFKWVSSSYQVAKVLEFQLQHQSFQWILRTDFL